MLDLAQNGGQQPNQGCWGTTAQGAVWPMAVTQLPDRILTQEVDQFSRGAAIAERTAYFSSARAFVPFSTSSRKICCTFCGSSKVGLCASLEADQSSKCTGVSTAVATKPCFKDSGEDVKTFYTRLMGIFCGG